MPDVILPFVPPFPFGNLFHFPGVSILPLSLPPIPSSFFSPFYLSSFPDSASPCFQQDARAIISLAKFWRNTTGEAAMVFIDSVAPFPSDRRQEIQDNLLR